MLRSSISCVLAVLVVLPLAVSAQPSTADPQPQDRLRLTLADPTGDLHTAEGEIVAGPDSLDITSLQVAIDGDDLLVTVEVAGEAADALLTQIGSDFGLWMWLPGTPRFEWIHVTPAERWAISQQLDLWEREPMGTAEVSGSRIEFRVSRSPLIAPEKLRFSAYAYALPSMLDQLPDVRSFSDRRDSPLPSPTVQPAGASVVEPSWSGLVDQVPNSETTAAAWVAFDGTLSPTDEDWPGPLRSPLIRAAATRQVLGQRDRAIGSPRVSGLRERVDAFFDTHAEAVALMPALDGLGLFDDRSMFDVVLDLVRTEGRKSEVPQQGRLAAAAAATAAFIYIAERADDPALRSAAIELADGFYDLALTRINSKRRGRIDDAARRSFDLQVRQTLEGFAW